MKNKELIIISTVVVLLALGITVYESFKPKPIDWRPHYSASEKSPFGLYVLDKEAPQLFVGDEVHKFWMSPYEFFDAQYDYDAQQYDINGSFIQIEEENSIDRASVKELMHFADYGNTVMLSMKYFPEQLLDTLSIEIEYSNFQTDSVQIALQENPADLFWLANGASTTYFSKLPGQDSIKVLGFQKYRAEQQPNFIEAKFGKGRFILHTQPAVFSNLYLLKDDYFVYAQKALSHLPKGALFWRNDTANNRHFEYEGSSIRYIMSQPGLKWAWRLGLWGLLFFMIFNARRRQRVVPVIAPVRNTTVDFAKTIGNLYYQEGDHHTIIDKKIVYFLEHIRTEYLIDTAELNDSFIEKLHEKTGKPIEDIRNAIEVIKKYRHNFTSTAQDVVAINNAIEKIRL